MEAERGLVTDPKSHSLEVAETTFNPNALNESHSLWSGMKPWSAPLPAFSPRTGRGSEVVRPKGYKTDLWGPERPPTLVPGCGEVGQRPSGLEAWETLGDPRPGRAEGGLVRTGHATQVPPGPRRSPERALTWSLSPPGGRPQSASGDLGELSSKDSGRLWKGWGRGITVIIITSDHLLSNWQWRHSTIGLKLKTRWPGFKSQLSAIY